jgi:hypothetical protein
VITDPDWDVTEMVDRWMAGESPLKLSRAYGVPESEIRRHLKKQMTHQMQDMRRLRGGPRKSQPSEDLPKPKVWKSQAKCFMYRNNKGVFFTEMDIREQKEVCTGIQARQKGRPRRVIGMECPVRKECFEFGVMGPPLVRPLEEVYGGEHPRVIWDLQKEKKKEGAK